MVKRAMPKMACMKPSSLVPDMRGVPRSGTGRIVMRLNSLGLLGPGCRRALSISMIFDMYICSLLIVLSAFVREQKNSDHQKQNQHFVIWQISALFHYYLSKGGGREWKQPRGGGDSRNN